MMAEWHQPPDHIVNNWTDELLDLMIQKFNERHKVKPAEGEPKVSDDTFFRQAGIKVKKR